MAKQNQYFPQSRPHPGETLKEKLEEMGMGSKEFAIRAAKPEKTISEILNGKSSITADMAVQFESVTQIPAHFWLNAQRAYDEYIAREKQESIIQSALNWAKSFPLKEMVRREWISKRNSIEESAKDLLIFFGVANHLAWKDYYFNQQLKVAFRISLSSVSQPYAISAWLRKGELEAENIKVSPYSEKDFKEALKEARSLMVEQPSDFFPRLQEICGKAGVKLVYTPCLPKAPLNGATRWIKDNPIIQITGRYKRYDTLWFTFFHEAGHIILHGKKDIFLEDVQYSDLDLKKEDEADEFAISYTLTKDQENEIISSLPLNRNTIVSFAIKFHTHPSLIVGRLQHLKKIRHTEGRDLIKFIDLE